MEKMDQMKQNEDLEVLDSIHGPILMEINNTLDCSKRPFSPWTDKICKAKVGQSGLDGQDGEIRRKI